MDDGRHPDNMWPATLITNEMLSEVIATYIQNNPSDFTPDSEAIQTAINLYVTNKISLLFSNDLLKELVKFYIERKASEVFDKIEMIESVIAFFKQKHKIDIDRSLLTTIIDKIVADLKPAIVTIEMVKTLMHNYLQSAIQKILSHELVSDIISRYVKEHQEFISSVFGSIIQNISPIKNISISSVDMLTVTLSNNVSLNLTVYDGYATVRDRVQSIVYVPKYTDGLVTVDASSNTELSFTVSDITAEGERLTIKATASGLSEVDGAAVALRIKEKNKEGSNYMTDFTVIYK